jgi:hypothetical protein
MAINKIIKFGVEHRAIELRSDPDSTLKSIAKILSDEIGQKISYQTVYRYFDTHDKEKARAVESSSKLMAKVAEAEIDTIELSISCVKELAEISELAKNEGDYRNATMAIDKMFTGIDIVNKILGKYPNAGQNINLNFENNEQRIVVYIPENNRDQTTARTTRAILE